MSNAELWYTLGVIVLFGLGFGLRWGAKHYANTQVAVVMLAVEKKLTTWAHEKAAEGEDKRAAAVQAVTDYVYPLLPPVVKLFVSRPTLVLAIEKLYGQMLNYLDAGAVDDKPPE